MTESDVLEKYPQVVVVRANNDNGDNYVYVGKLFQYGSGFITLNPFTRITGSMELEPEARKLNGYKTGTARSQKTIGRRFIDSIQTVIL